MKKIVHVIKLALLIVLLVPRYALADPIYISSYSIFFPVLLFWEGVIIVYWSKIPMHQIRFALIWFAVTSITWFIFVYPSQGLLTFMERYLRGLMSEIAVVYTEMVAIFILLRWDYIVKDKTQSPTLIESFIYSVVVNMFSFMCGYLL